MRHVPWHLPFAIGAAVVLASAPAAAPAQTASPSPPVQLAQASSSDQAAVAGHASYVGAQACADCHEDQVKTWEHNPHHGSQIDSNPTGKKEVECESCHGPGSLHVEAGGDKDNPGFHTIRNLKTMKADASSEVCATCHRAAEQFHWKSSTHARNRVACVDCHAVHSSKDPGGQNLLQATGTNELCFRCHTDKRSQVSHVSHMPVSEGSMTCADCHNPHGSPGPHMIRGASNNELCETCHMDKRGPFLWEHPPVREDCLNCHEPHGSNNDKMLVTKRPFLCQRCHVATRHPSTLYDLPDLTGSNRTRIVDRGCANCHTQVHGSNHPSGETLLR
jgi:DmsE family decaheme c-type cytochrome